jgi:Glycosyl hydrolase family 9
MQWMHILCTLRHRLALTLPVALLQRLYASQSGFAGYGDELAWAAANLYRATKEGRYLRDARNFYGRVSRQAPRCT